MANLNPPKVSSRKDRDYLAYYDYDGKTVRAVGIANFQELADAISGEGGERLVDFGEINAMAAGGTQTLLSLTVPAGETYVVGNILCSGNRIAIYEVLLDGSVIARRRTWYSDFNAQFPFIRADFNAGANIQVRVTNNDYKTGDFEATLSGVKR